MSVYSILILELMYGIIFLIKINSNKLINGNESFFSYFGNISDQTSSHFSKLTISSLQYFNCDTHFFPYSNKNNNFTKFQNFKSMSFFKYGFSGESRFFPIYFKKYYSGHIFYDCSDLMKSR